VTFDKAEVLISVVNTMLVLRRHGRPCSLWCHKLASSVQFAYKFVVLASSGRNLGRVQWT